MPRARFGVVLLIPPPFATEIDGLRRACGDAHRERIPPHITLVPPVNVRGDDIGAALAVLREAGSTLAADGSLTLTLGPARSFRPDTDTLYLAVSGSTEAVRALSALRDAVFRAPLERQLDWPFVPHVTIAEGIDPARIDLATGVLGDYVVDVCFDRVHLLEQQRLDGGGRVWEPVADAPFERSAIVGRGGVELELSVSSLVDPEGVACERDAAETVMRELSVEPAPAVSYRPIPRVVTARRRGEVVGVARGWEWGEHGREMVAVAVREPWRGQGIGRQLYLTFNA